MKSCTVTAANGDLWSTLVSVLGGESSLPITTIHPQMPTATVTILPTLQELWLCIALPTTAQAADPFES